MTLARWSMLTAGAACALALSGCVVAPVDGAYYGNAYTTVSAPVATYDYPYYGYPYYGGSSLWIGSSSTYVYGGRPYYRPGPGYWGGGHHHGGSRPGFGGGRPDRISPGAGASLGRPLAPSSGGSRPSFGGGWGGGHRR
ncbi:MAG: hypothetical protein ACN6O3_17815 [Comamonas sp.]